jgi:hypothetical protein
MVWGVCVRHYNIKRFVLGFIDYMYGINFMRHALSFFIVL